MSSAAEAVAAGGLAEAEEYAAELENVVRAGASAVDVSTNAKPKQLDGEETNRTEQGGW